MNGIIPAGKGYVKYRYYATREKIYAASFLTGMVIRIAKKKHKTASEAKAYCINVVVRYESLVSVFRPTFWVRVQLLFRRLVDALVGATRQLREMAE